MWREGEETSVDHGEVDTAGHEQQNEGAGHNAIPAESLETVAGDVGYEELDGGNGYHVSHYGAEQQEGEVVALEQDVALAVDYELVGFEAGGTKHCGHS